MRIKSSTRNLVILMVAFLTLLSALMFLGNLANNRFNEIITSLIKSQDRPSPGKGIERIRTLLGESELTVKAYTLTKDEEFMAKFYDLVYETIDQLDAFDHDSLAYSSEINESLDTLELLALRRINLFETIIETGDEFRVERAMNKVSSAITGLNQDLKTDASEIPQEEKKKGLFKKKTEINTDEVAEQINKKSESVLTSFQSGLKELSSIEKSKEARLRSVILNLSQDGEKLNAKIDSISAFIDEIETQTADIEAQRIASIAASSRTAVRFGVVVSVILVLVFTTLIFIQIRSSNRFAKAARRASKEAVNLAEAKERFVANVSHELRTPLNSIIGFSELIEETKDQEQLKEFQGMIKSSAEHLGALVNDLLDWSKIDAGKFALEHIPFSPREVIDEVRNMTYYAKNRKNVQFILRSDIKSIYLNGDPTRLRQMLINLLGNAFKFTETGTVTLSVTERDFDEKTAELTLQIIDTGIGIPKEKLHHVFGDFEQVDSSTSRKFGGSGLGLAITKRLVDLHHGEISVDSEMGKGTTFTIKLFYEKTNSGTFSNSPVNEVDLKKLKILIVDDSHLNRSLLSTILRKKGCTVDEASTAFEALDLVRNNDYHFGLFDIKMPEMDGFELAEKVKKIDKKHIKLIALTAAPTKDVMNKGKAAGYEAILGKPIEKDQLYKLLSGEKVDIEFEEDSKISEPIDLKLIENIFENDEQFRNEMLNAFVTTFEKELPHLAKAIEESNYTRIDDLTHKLLPSCRQIGAKNLIKQLEQLKNEAQNKASSALLSECLRNYEKEFNQVKKSIDTLIS